MLFPRGYADLRIESIAHDHRATTGRAVYDVYQSDDPRPISILPMCKGRITHVSHLSSSIDPRGFLEADTLQPPGQQASRLPEDFKSALPF
jgi:hypothetical protein